MTEITTFNNNTERLASLIAQGEPINEANLATYGIGQLGNNTERLLLILGIAIQNLPTKVIPTVANFSELPAGYRGLAIVADDPETADNSNVYLVDDNFQMPLINTDKCTDSNIRSLPEKLVKSQKTFWMQDEGYEGFWRYNSSLNDSNCSDNTGIFRKLNWSGNVGYIERVFDKTAINLEWWGFSKSTLSALQRTSIIHDAIQYAKLNGIKTINIPSGFFTVKTITTYRGITLQGNKQSKTVLQITSDANDLVVVESDEIPTSTKEVVMRDVYLTTNQFDIQYPYNSVITVSPNNKSVTYQSTSTALVFKTSHVDVENVSVSGFENATRFESNAYIITLRNCTSQFNKYGFVFDRTGYSNSGERIVLDDTTIANNFCGIRNKGGMIYMQKGSLDYNYNKWILNENISEAGLSNSLIYTKDTHLESNAEGNLSDLIDNSAILSLNGTLWIEGDSESIANIINNRIFNASLNLDLFLRFDSSKYLVLGYAPDNCKIAYLSASNRAKIHYKDNLLSQDVNQGSIISLTSIHGTVTASTTKKLNNPYSLKITDWLYGQGEFVTKNIRPKGSALAIQLWVNGIGDTSGIQYTIVKFFDKSNALLDTKNLTCTLSGEDKFIRTNLSKTDIPRNCQYFTITIKTVGSGGSNYLYIDDLIVDYFGSLNQFDYEL